MRIPGAARVWLVCVLLLLLTGCAQALSLGSGAGRDLGGGRVSLSPLLDPDSVAIPGTNAAAVIDVLGEPDEIIKEEAPEAQRPGRAVTLVYDGLDVVVHELYRPGRNFIADIVVTSRSYRTRLGVRVGDTRREIEAVLGEPVPPADGQTSSENGSEAPSEVAAPADESVYALTDEGDTVTVTYDNDRAVKLVYHYERG